jgi:hypothetical protein
MKMTVKDILEQAERSKAVIRSRCKMLCAQVEFGGAKYTDLIIKMRREFEMITSFHFYWANTHDTVFSYECEDVYEKNAVKFFAAGYNYDKQ